VTGWRSLTATAMRGAICFALRLLYSKGGAALTRSGQDSQPSGSNARSRPDRTLGVCFRGSYYPKPLLLATGET